ncbi:hypothetical protein BU16DRAFT_526314 [Lophium mytilinum]|uniref:Uncharacterized protein n=1 Tax=Lophium mytilinum TaxID=390894 RepID=A0A6A6QTA9_9PEZI|nr:hypothetical protein BU16DRAFT_526314 [Lophium mytilinum]
MSLVSIAVHVFKAQEVSFWSNLTATCGLLMTLKDWIFGAHGLCAGAVVLVAGHFDSKAARLSAGMSATRHPPLLVVVV